MFVKLGRSQKRLSRTCSVRLGWHSGVVNLSTAALSAQPVSMQLADLVTKPSKVLFSIRTRVRRGGLRKGKIHMKRKPSKAGISKITMAKNTQRIAEERVARHFPNLEVLNSYWVGEDGKHKFFEVILIDTHHPAIINDKQLGVFCQANGNNSHRGRAYRGKTSAGKRGRGLFNKGKGAEKLRPSLKANLNRGK